MHIRNDPSFFLTNKTGAPQGEQPTRYLNPIRKTLQSSRRKNPQDPQEYFRKSLDDWHILKSLLIPDIDHQPTFAVTWCRKIWKPFFHVTSYPAF
ncbi:hypothetical protein Tco_1274219 [Tanacetum coccineum]